MYFKKVSCIVYWYRVTCDGDRTSHASRSRITLIEFALAVGSWHKRFASCWFTQEDIHILLVYGLRCTALYILQYTEFCIDSSFAFRGPCFVHRLSIPDDSRFLPFGQQNKNHPLEQNTKHRGIKRIDRSTYYLVWRSWTWTWTAGCPPPGEGRSHINRQQ